MGKKLIIKDADFSANSVEKDAVWQTVLSGSITHDGSGTESDHSLYSIPVVPNIPNGTLTRVTQTLSGTGYSSIGTRDSDNITHNTFWHSPISSKVGTVSDEKELTFDMKTFLIWIQNLGSTCTYKLEILIDD